MQRDGTEVTGHAWKWHWDALGGTGACWDTLGSSRLVLQCTGMELGCVGTRCNGTGTNWSVMLGIGIALGQTGMELKCAGMYWHGTGVHWDGTRAALVCTGVALGGTVTRLGA